MMFGLIVTTVILVIAVALDKTRDIPLPPLEVRPLNRRVYTPGVVIRTGQLGRVIAARRAVRGDDGYVKGNRA